MGRAAKNRPQADRQAAKLARIMAATRQLLGEVGVERMTMRDLAAKSRVSAATLYNRFGTKDRLVAAVVVDHYDEAVAGVVARRVASQSPLEQIVEHVRVIVRDCQRLPGFAEALMSAYFKVGNDREMPTRLYASLLQSWLPPIQQMETSGALRPWVCARQLTEELCDRMFGAVMKWSQGLTPRRLLMDRALLSVLLPLAGASTGPQADEIAALLARTSNATRAPSPSSPRRRGSSRAG